MIGARLLAPPGRRASLAPVFCLAQHGPRTPLLRTPWARAAGATIHFPLRSPRGPVTDMAINRTRLCRAAMGLIERVRAATTANCTFHNTTEAAAHSATVTAGASTGAPVAPTADAARKHRALFARTRRILDGCRAPAPAKARRCQNGSVAVLLPAAARDCAAVPAAPAHNAVDRRAHVCTALQLRGCTRAVLVRGGQRRPCRPPRSNASCTTRRSRCCVP